MGSPAEAYAASRARNLVRFAEHYPFDLDPFQVTACQALERGSSVLVAAPTGAGKTIVGEFAVYLALEAGQKCFYTTPIKALSNQKYLELVDRYGAQRVGLLTGDNAINSEAPIVVMTTEVLRNMIYAESKTLHGLGYVVMDEVHYLADRFRGGVWEEVILHLPESVTLIALSATVSNAEEFGAWLQEVRGETTIVVEEHRPVPLWQHVFAGDRIHDLFIDDDLVNPKLVQFAQRSPRGRHHRRDRLTPWRVDVVEALERDDLLPAIYFLFSRKGCDEAVEQCLRGGLNLTSRKERESIRRQVDAATERVPDEDLGALDFPAWREALERGIAAHHAGMLPLFKETVESLFQQGLIKVVFATETLALGINMPARSVILEKLVKWNGEQHVALTPGEYTQLTGRAGRRGIDVEGHAVVLWHTGIDPRVVAGLASTRTYPLRSSFSPSYNMAVNLVASMGRHLAREVLETSFAQFQADRSVVGMAKKLRRLEEAYAGYVEAMECHLGDFTEYAAIRRELTDLERGASRLAARREAQFRFIRGLRPGDVFWFANGPVVVTQAEGERVVVIDTDARSRRVRTAELPDDASVLHRLRLPKRIRDAAARTRIAEQLSALALDRPQPAADIALAQARKRLRNHPCHGCADREAHARWAERAHRTKREIADAEKRISRRTSSIADRFDAVCAVLTDLGYLTDDDSGVTARGQHLRRLYGESDLLAAQCLVDGVWSDLEPAELAAVVSALVYESRLDEQIYRPVPGGAVAEALDRMDHLWSSIHDLERRHRLDLTRQPDMGFVWATYRWARGAKLADVLRREDISAGDFVRWMRQVIDLLGQLFDAGELHAEAAIALLRRGVVLSLEGVGETGDVPLDTPLTRQSIEDARPHPRG